MKKQKTTMVTLAMLVCFLCTACGSSGGSSSESSSSSSSSPSSSSSASSLSSSSSAGSLSNFGNFGSSNNAVDDGSDSGDISLYVGLWEYVDENLWLMVYEDETWEFYNDQEDVIQSGILLLDEYGIMLCFDDGSVMQLDCTEDGSLLDVDNDGTLIPADSIQSRVPYFTRNGLELNAAVGKGGFLLKNGVNSYYNLGTGYTVGDCYWEVVRNSDKTSDGIREIQFDAVCYVPSSSLGSFDQSFLISTDSGLYDFYTGKWFNTNVTYTEQNKTERADNSYVTTVDWNGQSWEIEYSYSTNTEFYVGDWYMIFTKSYLVYLPEDYDGLIFAAITVADNYEDHMKQKQQGETTTESCILDSDPTAPYNYLYFSVCY